MRFGIEHNGNDLVANEGTVIVAPEMLKVVSFNTDYVGNTYPDKMSNGNYITAISMDGERKYAFLHLKNVPKVSAGQILPRGVKFAEVGNTGFSTKAHLHLSVEDVKGKYNNLRKVGNYVSFFDLQKII